MKFVALWSREACVTFDPSLSDDSNIAALLARWFSSGDELAHRRAYEGLARCLRARREVLDVLSADEIDEIRQDVLSRLLDRDSGKLRDAQSPEAYAKTVFRNALTTALRKWGPRGARSSEVAAHIEQRETASPSEEAERRLDVERAVRIAESLPGKGRLAVLLTSCPDKISDRDWADVVVGWPPPPPERPSAALEREEASLLLYPPTSQPETTVQRYQRLNSFDKAYKRAIQLIRAALEEDE